ncbi:hypothetical protein B0186_08495 [Canicola haemoglobinophilus]|uniref:Putative soluble lytic murein transglycosylase n=1 Tax=Canicola haemoglobinophilus TaxID=733 RepID=A0A1V4AZS3_9PAST|nr:transglycosylase SLT domain-containing protein [Canicola haemoglobinophilus]OOR98826.1 hypothetical protein B0186_08495 [Canicola haemoglobinophilus]STO60938.1 putative soluble lytic murein transglycosylase [Canicola haemoglobinophilus]
MQPKLATFGFLLFATALSSFATKANTVSNSLEEIAQFKQTITQQQQQIQQLQDQFLLQEKRHQQREIYQKLTEYLKKSDSENTLQITENLLAELADYPLYPYAQYQWLKQHKPLTFEQIKQLSQRYPDFILLNELKKAWLKQAKQQQNWQDIIDNAHYLAKDTTTKCTTLEAQIEIAKKNQKSTALSDYANEIQKLWLNGNSLPTQCDPIFSQWQQEYLTDELLQQRAVFAFEKGNSALLSHLINQANGDMKTWLNDLLLLLKSPLRLQNGSQNSFHINNLDPNNPVHQRVLLSIFPAFIKKLPESQLNINEPFAQFETWAHKFQLNAEQITQWKKYLISHIFDTDITQLQQWRDTQLQLLKIDQLTERRIRMAIRQQENRWEWLNQLSEQGKKKEEWQYWIAVELEKQGKHKQAQQILQNMRNSLGFYPMLANQELGTEYRPTMQYFYNQQLEQDIAQKFASEFARIQELKLLNEHSYVKQEWQQLLAQANQNEKLALAKYAETQQWYDLQVESTIQAKAWQYIHLRLPNAYQTWFDTFLKNKKIHRTFAMAIARQESAWQANVTSSANARGLMQLLPSTAKLTAQKFNLPYNNENQLFDPIDNIMLGTQHLAELYDKYGNNRILIAAAYNAGAKRVEQWLQKSNGTLSMAEFVATIPFYETRGYVQNVLTYAYYYQLLQNLPVQKFTEEEYNRTY